jgi:xanthine dehydrogenase accessory factor
MPEVLDTLTSAIKKAKLVAVATIIAGPGLGKKLLIWPGGQTVGSLGAPGLDMQVQQRVADLLRVQHTERFSLFFEEQPVEVFAEIHAPPPKLIIVGGVHIAIPLVTFGKVLGFYTIVLDARSAFATPERFGHADQLIIQWPADALPEIGIDESTYIVVLTHDEKIDNPALEIAVRSPAHYIGALGSKKTHARRVAALQGAGATPEQIARIHSPIGLEIGARRPEEIAVSIIAQIVAVMNKNASV